MARWRIAGAVAGIQFVTSALFALSLSVLSAAMPSVADAHQYPSTGSPHGYPGASCPSGQARMWRQNITSPWVSADTVVAMAPELCKSWWGHCRYSTTFTLNSGTAAQNSAFHMESNHANEVFEQPASMSFSSQCQTPPTAFTAALPPTTSNGRDKGGSCPECGNPVNPANGNKYQREVDYRGSGPQALAFERSYNSFSPGSGDMGAGWQHNYSRSLGADYGLPEAYSPGSATQSASHASAEAACEQGWLEIRNRQPGLAATTATYEGTSCNLYEGTTLRGQAPIQNSAFVPPSNPPLQAFHVVRADGKSMRFAANGSAFEPPSDATIKLEAVSGGYRLTDSSDTVELYNSSGQFTSITDRGGYTQTLTYVSGKLTEVTDSYGRKLTFGYVGDRIATLTDPDNKVFTYAYDGDKLTTFTGPDNEFRTYLYEDANFPNALTGIRDEDHIGGSPDFAHWTYDAMGRVLTSEHAGGLDDLHQFTYLGANAQGYWVTTVEDALGAARTYEFQSINGAQKVRKITQPCLPACGTSTSETTYDGSGFVDTKTDFNGNVTDYTFDARGLEASRTEAFGTPLARTITTQWHPTLRLPAQVDEPGRRTAYTYDPSTGDRLTQTVTDLATSESRTTTWTYTTAGRVQTVNGPRTDVSDVTTYAYYQCATGAECGQLHTITNALGHVTEITSYDAHGNPLAIVDANGVPTVLNYDLRLRLTMRTVNGVMTTFEYSGVGQLDKVMLPGGAFLDYAYDGARRLTDIEDNLGNRIHYTLDGLGNRTKEEAFDPAGVLKRRQEQVFDALGRIDQVKNATGQVTTDYGYDAQGNRTSQADYSTPTTSHSTTFVPDALNRIKQVTDAANGVTLYGYNALDQLTSVEDPKGLTTSYTLNALGDLTQQVSPDTGTTQYPVYDAAGNRKRQIDARGVQVDYTYDALNRLTSVTYPPNAGEDVAYSYDSVTQPYGKGRLTGITEPSGTTTLVYDARGNVTEEQRTIWGETHVTSYAYDSADRLVGIIYPTGRTVTYERGNALGQVTRVTTTVSGATTTVADNIAYMPFGGVKNYTLGNGVVVTRSHDLDYRLDEIKDQGVALIQELRLFYDLRGNADATQDVVSPGRSQTFGYDELSRLTQAAGQYGAREYAYDAVGNRLTETMTPPGGSAVTDTYNYPSNSHRLSSITGANAKTFEHDGAGHALTNGSTALEYNAAGRAYVTIDPKVYSTYNAAGQRVEKDGLIFHYDREGHLLAETVANVRLREYIWLGDLPLSIEGVANEPAVVVDNGDSGFSTTGNWSSSTAASGYYGADYAVRPAGAISGTQVLDNGASGTTKSGNWQARTGPAGYYGSNFERSNQAAAQYSWSLPVTTAGEYKIYVRYPSDPTFRSKANYAVSFASGSTTYEIDQRSGGGGWRLLGTHSLTTSVQVTLTVGAGSSGSYLVADAVRIVPLTAEHARWSVPAPRTYDVFARWPASITHSADAAYRIVHAGGTTEVTVAQQFWGDFWMYLGTFEFSNTATQSVMLLADESWAVAADAVMFQPAFGTSPTLRGFYHLDHLGTPQKLTDSSQTVIWDASYEPFGKANLFTEGLVQPLRFPGQYFDAETGLHQNWHRDYDPSIGRYLQSDPIGLQGGLNTYGYVGQNPLSFVDPTGEQSQRPSIPPSTVKRAINCKNCVAGLDAWTDAVKFCRELSERYCFNPDGSMDFERYVKFVEHFGGGSLSGAVYNCAARQFGVQDQADLLRTCQKCSLTPPWAR